MPHHHTGDDMTTAAKTNLTPSMLKALHALARQAAAGIADDCGAYTRGLEGGFVCRVQSLRAVERRGLAQVTRASIIGPVYDLTDAAIEIVADTLRAEADKLERNLDARLASQWPGIVNRAKADIEAAATLRKMATEGVAFV
jgi:hypothetical protein